MNSTWKISSDSQVKFCKLRTVKNQALGENNWEAKEMKPDILSIHMMLR